jgi:hypothetical protein
MPLALAVQKSKRKKQGKPMTTISSAISSSIKDGRTSKGIQSYQMLPPKQPKSKLLSNLIGI